MGVFESDIFYAASVFPVRNPFPGSHTGPLNEQLWRVELRTTGGEILETTTGAPMGPELRGFKIYPQALYEPAVAPSGRRPGEELGTWGRAPSSKVFGLKHLPLSKPRHSLMARSIPPCMPRVHAPCPRPPAPPCPHESCHGAPPCPI